MPVVASWVSPKARKGARSAIAGRGLFAVAPIVEGEVVAVKGGHVVSAETLQSLSPKLQETEIQLAEDLHLVALTDDASDQPLAPVDGTSLGSSTRGSPG